MPLTASAVPREISAALAGGLPGALAPGSSTGPPRRAVRPRVHVSAEHPVYTLDPAQLAAGRWVPAARLVAWAFLVRESARRPWLLTHVTPPRRGRPATLTSPSREIADQFVSALADAERLREVRRGRFEVRRLVCRPAGLMGLWLANLDGGGDVHLPVCPVGPPDPDDQAARVRWRLAACRHLLAAAELAAAAAAHARTPAAPC